MNNLIYKYIKLDTNEVVYIGRTNNFMRRKREHEVYEPFEKNRPQYDYPLSRGIRKYGLNNYKCEIIEDNLTYEQSLVREKYWIAFYHTYDDPSKYNQSPGGENITEPIYSDAVIDYVKELLIEQVPFSEIQEETGISLSHISEINTGKRRYDTLCDYPLNKMTCGRKLNKTQVNEIITLLKETNLSVQDISHQYNVSNSVIECINKGKHYKQTDIKYPIRARKKQTTSHHLTPDEIKLLISDIVYTDESFEKLAQKYKVSITTIYNINSGRTRKQDQYIYPLRQKQEPINESKKNK